MDTRKLIDLLRATLELNQRQQAEEQLNQVHKIIGFVPTLLQIVMQNDLEMPIRQAGAIYLKNLVTQSWQDREQEPGQALVYSIHEQDRAMIRESIVEAIVHAPELIRLQIAICLNHIIKQDFPGRWTQVVDKISIYLQNPDVNGWCGALICMYQLVKNYEYKKSEERTPLTEAMNLLLPMIYNLIVNLMNDQSEQSVLLQKQILKIYHALTQHSLPLDLISKESFAQWMEVCRQIADRPCPDSSHIEEDERPELPWWKAKKWALHIMVRMFERYGSPNNVVTKEYEKFAEWYLQTFTNGVLEVLLKLLDQYRNKIYVSPRVLTDVLSYLKTAILHSYSWKLLKPHTIAIIQDVIFPIMSFTQADQEMWETDPYEYIRIKFDVFEDYATPVPAAQSFLFQACRKRVGILPKTMQAIMQIITSPTADAKQKDGALHMVGSLAEILLKKKYFRDQMESMIVTYVFPEFQSPQGHLRARACWVLQNFSEIKIKNPQVLAEIIRLTTNGLLTDTELPVKVQAAIALQMYLTSQDQANCAQYLENQIKPITLEILTIIRETENEDLTNVMQKIVCTFTEQLTPIAVEICQHLATTFDQVLESDENSDDKAVSALGVLNTIDTLLSVMEDQPSIIANLHPIVIRVIGHIFQSNEMDFYEEAFSLVYDLTSKSISPEMWHMLELIYTVFQQDGHDFFIDMMPALHNYITVDTEAFLSNENYVLAIFNMCKAILTSDSGEDSESHAAKLLEVMILQCKGRIDNCVPSFIELVVTRLMREVKSSELRTMCLQVVIAALYYNPQLLLTILDKMPMNQNSNDSLCAHFIKQWIHDTDCFLGIHDRKLCVLGLCTLISLGDARPSVLGEISSRILPSLILLFDGLKRAYAARAQEIEEEASEDEDEDCEEALSSDEDDIDELGPNYYERLASFSVDKGAQQGFEITASLKDAEDDDSDDDDDSSDELDETALETYSTPIDNDEQPECVDEYIVFKEVITNLNGQDPVWYNMLTTGLTQEQTNTVQEIMHMAELRKAQKQSKQIENSGGFAFTQQTVPTSFNFNNA